MAIAGTTRTMRGWSPYLAAGCLVVATTPAALANPESATQGGQSSEVTNTQIDPARSYVDFTVRFMWLIHVTGRFGEVTGRVNLDTSRDEVQVEASIDANTVQMKEHSYENWVKSSEFFDAANHPHIRFVSDDLPRTRLRDGGDLPGLLTLRGIAHRVEFHLQPSRCEKPGRDCPIEVRGMIRRAEFGMHSRRGTLGEKVTLHFSVYTVAHESSAP